jgi:uncharacterized protein YjbK
VTRTPHQEIELKRLLGGDGAADRLVRALGAVASDLQQINHVFDTRDFSLHQSRFALRLRSEDGKNTLTAKGPGVGVSASVTSRTEAEVEIEAEVALEIRSGQLDPVAVLRDRARDGAYAELWSGIERARRGQPLREIGHFANRRRTVRVALPSGIGLHVEVDQTRFPDGRVDEEVEAELPSAELAIAVEAWLDDLATKAGVETKPSSAKLARFYTALAAGAR